jgi:hypothetical protein
LPPIEIEGETEYVVEKKSKLNVHENEKDDLMVSNTSYTGRDIQMKKTLGSQSSTSETCKKRLIHTKTMDLPPLFDPSLTTKIT